MNTKPESKSAASELGDLEREQAAKQESLQAAIADANADGVLTLRACVAELAERISFQRVLVAREAIAAVEAEMCPHHDVDVNVKLAAAEAKQAEGLRLLGEARSEADSALADSRAPQEWESERGMRLQAARAALSAAEAAARGGQPAQPAQPMLVIDAMGPPDDRLRNAMAGGRR